jgi:molybdenum cofactor cytidylyltransferase
VSEIVVGVVLVAGESTRLDLGYPKQLLDVDGRSMARVSVEAAVASSLDRVVAVIGRAAGDVGASLADSGAAVVLNPDYRTGNLSSLLAGVDAAGELDAVMVLLGDMPEVDAAAIDAVAAAWRTDRPWAAYTVFADGRPNHPFVLSASAIGMVRGAGGPKPLWRLLVTDPPYPVLAVTLPRPVPVDVDTEADYDTLLSRRADQGSRVNPAAQTEK